MKMIGNAVFAAAISRCMSSPLRPGKRTSSTMQPGRSGRLLCRNSCGDPNSSTSSPTEWNRLSSALRIDGSSSMTTIVGGCWAIAVSGRGPIVTCENIVELTYCRARATRMGPDRADDGKKIGARLDQRPAILLGNAADCNARHHRRLRPVAQHFGPGAMLGRLCRAREEGAEGDIIGAGLGGDQRAVPAVAAGYPDDAVGPEEAARLGVGHILLADMDAVAIELGGEVGPIVHNEGDAALLRDRLQNAGGAADRVVLDLLQAQLQARNIAAGERFLQLPGKNVGVERGRRDQIKPGRRPRLVSADDQSFP